MHVHVVVEVVLVLRGIEHLEQRRRGVALVPTPELVDLVEHDHGVRGPRLLECLNDFAGHRTHVRPAVPLDLRHVRHTAHGEAEKLAAERGGDRRIIRREQRVGFVVIE